MSRVPVEPATVLGLELLLQEPALDLSMACELICNDVGATLQVLWAGATGDGGAQPRDVHEVLADVPAEAWFGAVCAHSTAACRNPDEVRAMWHHCRLVGQYAKCIAERFEGVQSEVAYMAGLLHEVDAIPRVLELHFDAPAVPEVQVGDVLPERVLRALQSARERGAASMWHRLLSSAHALAAAAPSSRANA